MEPCQSTLARCIAPRLRVGSVATRALTRRSDRRQRGGRQGVVARVRTLGSWGARLIVAASSVHRFDPYKRDATRITDLCDMLSAATANTIKEGTSMEDDDEMQAERPGLEAEGSGPDGDDEGICKQTCTGCGHTCVCVLTCKHTRLQVR